MDGLDQALPLEAQPEPRNLRRVKGEVLRRWGSVALVDMLKETILRTGCLDTVTSRATGSSIPRSVLAERLLLAIHAYGTNTGLRAVASAGYGHSEDELASSAEDACWSSPPSRRCSTRPESSPAPATPSSCCGPDDP